MDHVPGPLHIFIGGKEGRISFNITCLKHDQFKKITSWCLSVLESVIEIVLEFTLQNILKFVPREEKNIKKVMISRNLRQAHLLGDHETLSIVHHVGLHVHFSPMKSSLDL